MTIITAKSKEYFQAVWDVKLTLVLQLISLLEQKRNILFSIASLFLYPIENYCSSVNLSKQFEIVFFAGFALFRSNLQGKVVIRKKGTKGYLARQLDRKFKKKMNIKKELFPKNKQGHLGWDSNPQQNKKTTTLVHCATRASLLGKTTFAAFICSVYF